MNRGSLTDAELLLLGLIAEMPRHGYELKQAIEIRGMREWTAIGSSSVYFVLAKLEAAGLVIADTPAGIKDKKTYTVTPEGRTALVTKTIEALSRFRPAYSSVLLGMAHWPALSRTEALSALAARGESVANELRRLERLRVAQQPQPDFIEALFDFSAGQLQAEQQWIATTLAYMQTKPWNE